MDVNSNVAYNIAALVQEGLGTYVLVVLGIGVGATAGLGSLGTGLGLGLATIFLTAIFWWRSGAHFNPGVSFAKILAVTADIHTKEYVGSYNVVATVVFYLAYVGMQLAGAVLAMLSLRYIDRSGFIATAYDTAPNGNLVGDNNRSLFALWLLNSVYLSVVLLLSSPRIVAKLRALGSPMGIGLAYFLVTMVAYAYGTGSVVNFAIDVAIARTIAGESSKRLWISIVAQMLGALTAFVVAWLAAKQDQIVEHKIKRHAAGKMPPHEHRFDLLASLFNRLLGDTAAAAHHAVDFAATAGGDAMSVALAPGFEGFSA